MKNLLIYIHPRMDFDDEHKRLARIQVDNSANLGWKGEDMLVVTNFPYEYNGIRAMEIDSSFCCDHDARTGKINAIVHLFELGLITGLTWFHDFDAYQLAPITEEELGLEGVDVGLTDLGWSSKWNTGSFFFKPSALGIFEQIKTCAYENKMEEEQSLMLLTGRETNGINDRIKRLNITYNLGMNHVDHNLRRATKPLKVVHFHPRKPGLMARFRPLLGDDLKGIFKRHGYE